MYSAHLLNPSTSGRVLAWTLVALSALAVAPHAAEAQYRPRPSPAQYRPRHAKQPMVRKVLYKPVATKALTKEGLRILSRRRLSRASTLARTTAKQGPTAQARPLHAATAASRSPYVVLRGKTFRESRFNLSSGRTSAIRGGIASSLQRSAAGLLPGGFKASQIRFRTQRVNGNLPSVKARKVEWYLPGTSLKGTANAFTPNVKNGGLYTQVGAVQLR